MLMMRVKFDESVTESRHVSHWVHIPERESACVCICVCVCVCVCETDSPVNRVISRRRCRKDMNTPGTHLAGRPKNWLTVVLVMATLWAAEESDTKKEKKERLRRKVGRGANNKNLKGKRRDSGDRKERKQKKEENFFKVSIFYKRERDKKRG